MSWALGVPFLRVVLSAEPGGSKVEPLPGAPRPALPEYSLIRAAGVIGDYQHRRLALRYAEVVKLLQGGGDGVIRYHDARTGLVTDTGRRSGAVAPGADLEYVAPGMARMPPEWCVHIWRGCEDYTAACRPAISAVADVLLERRELTYAEVGGIAGAAMAGRPVPPVPWAGGTGSRNDGRRQTGACEAG